MKEWGVNIKQGIKSPANQAFHNRQIETLLHNQVKRGKLRDHHLVMVGFDPKWRRGKERLPLPAKPALDSGTDGPSVAVQMFHVYKPRPKEKRVYHHVMTCIDIGPRRVIVDSSRGGQCWFDTNKEDHAMLDKETNYVSLAIQERPSCMVSCCPHH